MPGIVRQAQASTEAIWLSVCRQQVFCMQDHLLYESLTVWETVVFVPMPELPMSCELHVNS